MTRKPNVSSRTPRLRRLPIAMAAAIAGGLVQAAPPPDTLPTGGSVVQGSVNITPLTSLDLLVQQTSNGGIINWNTFSIGADATVTFQHPNANAVTLNRVITTAPSEIFGSLSANGRVFIINPNGVVFGNSAQVNVGGLVASTLGISDTAFNAGLSSGQFQFGDVGQDFYQDVTVQSGASIQASPGGTIALLGGVVENGGTLVANGGTVVMASAREARLDFFGDGLTQVALSALGSDDGGVRNTSGGVIQSDGGRIFMRASTYDGTADSASGYVDNYGVLRARSTAARSGTIEMSSAAGEVRSGQGSQIDATGGAFAGGRITLDGNYVYVGVQGTNTTTVLDASGASGGRIDLLASNYLELGGQTDSGGNGLFLRADASGAGAAGDITLRGGQGAKVEGSVSARGLGGGAGGNILTAANGGLLDARRLLVDAGGGTAGTWVLQSSGDFRIYQGSGFASGEPSGSGSAVWDSDISSALNTGTNVTVRASVPGPTSPGQGAIHLQSGASIVRGAGSSRLALRFEANTSINGFNFDVRSAAGPLDVFFNSNANGTNGANGRIALDFGRIHTNGGDLWMYGNSDPLSGFASGTSSGIDLYFMDIDTRVGGTNAGAGGSVHMRGSSVPGGFSNGGVVLMDTIVQTSTGDVTIHGQGSNTAGVALLGFSSSDGTQIRTTLGDVRITGIASQAVDGNQWIPGIDAISALIETAGGNIDLRARVSGSFGELTALSLQSTRVASNGGDISLSGQSTFQSAGIRVGESSSVDAGNGQVILRASNNGAAPAIRLEGTVASGALVNVRAGGVNVTGTTLDSSTQALRIGGANPFIDIQSLGRVTAPLLVVGHSAQAGVIEVAESWFRSGNLTLQNAGGGIQLSAPLDVGSGALTLASEGAISQQGTIRAGSLLVLGGAGQVNLTNPGNIVDGNTIAGSTSGNFNYTQAGTVTIGTVTGTVMSVTGAPTTTSVSGITAGGNVFVRSLGGNIVQLQGVSAGGNVDLVSAGVYLNSGAGLSAGGRWKVWADTWVGEDRGGLAGSGPLPNLYGCVFGGACVVSVDPAANQFIYAQRPVASVIIDPASREYGLANPLFTFSINGLILGDLVGQAITGNLVSPADASSNVGLYAITGVFESPAGYLFDVTPGVLAITPATLFYQANPFSRVYGDANGVLGGTVTGFRNGETLADATTGTLVWTTSATQASNVGSYAINGSGLSAQNYVFEQAAGNATALTITPATLFYQANPFSRVYGDANGVLGGTVTGFRNGETLADATTGTLAWTTSATQTSNVGSYAINGSGLSAQNYVFEQAAGNATALTITPATLLFVADPITRLFGLPNPPFTGTVTGFRNGETLADATTGTLVWTSPAGPGAMPGRYAIEGGGLQAQNYVFVQADSNATALTINPGPTTAIDVVRDLPTSYLYDRNFSPVLACPIAAPTDPLRADAGSDVLAREWTRVRSRPNLTSCISSERRNGCSDF